VLQTGALPEWDQAPLDAAYVVHRLFAAADRAAFLAEHAAAVRAIVTRGDLGADAGLIAACPALEVIVVYGVGYDAVDLAACRARGVRLANTPDVLTGDCADLAVAIALAQARGVVKADAFVREGRWLSGPFPLQRRFWGRRAGILGLGRIGMAVAERLAGFGMTIAYAARRERPVPWAFVPDPVALAAQSDILFVTLAASAETRHIVNAAVIAALGPAGLMVNISRAANVDEQALLAALETGALGGAALDVFEDEPKLAPRFLALPNVLLQPHVASGTVETRRAMGQLMRDNLAAHFAGHPLLTPVL
jgi:lactate dehydrogenase-like 2-hydroxyacid dehydrogenase